MVASSKLYKCHICGCEYIDFPFQHLFGCIAEECKVRNTTWKPTPDGWYVNFYRNIRELTESSICEVHFVSGHKRPYVLFEPNPMRIVSRASLLGVILIDTHIFIKERNELI